MEHSINIYHNILFRCVMNMFHFKKFEMPPAQHLMPYLFGDLNAMKKPLVGYLL